MNQADIVSAATQAAQQSKNILVRQADRQAAAVGATLARTASGLKEVGANLRESGAIGAAADIADWAADYVERTGRYFTNGNTDRFIVNAETFARDRPWTVAASAAALGFVAARVVKSSSARRFAETAYDPNYDPSIPSIADAEHGPLSVIGTASPSVPERSPGSISVPESATAAGADRLP